MAADENPTSIPINYTEEQLAELSSQYRFPFGTKFQTVINVYNPKRKSLIRSGENRAYLNPSSKGSFFINLLNKKEEYYIEKSEAQQAIALGEYIVYLPTNEILLYPCFKAGTTDTPGCSYVTKTYELVNYIRMNAGGTPWTQTDESELQLELVKGHFSVLDKYIKDGVVRSLETRLNALKRGGAKTRKHRSKNKSKRTSRKHTKKSRRNTKFKHKYSKRTTRKHKK